MNPPDPAPLRLDHPPLLCPSRSRDDGVNPRRSPPPPTLEQECAGFLNRRCGVNGRPTWGWTPNFIDFLFLSRLLFPLEKGIHANASPSTLSSAPTLLGNDVNESPSP